VNDQNLIIDEILACIDTRNELRLRNFLQGAKTHRFCPVWNTCVSLLAVLRERSPQDFDWLGWAVSGYPEYKAIVSDYFLYLYDRRNSLENLLVRQYPNEELN
jgi:hypothetical protein